ncbi:hypothetical protein [Janthinobacterium agaricidamnosum]|uniref:Uncharacterized protein n=1 Tax=Janthinobacterium agaricidamnosum NBRC 102515 = DSM 9628 TaxID=1349767 RepID=W0V2Y8_9BURK|nr:hypothetical protein [Janthinobacterium agaricidamnosum]CDG81637.1 hypothetical protein GJA_981 [Janthinobacterium agaricidamnosum NBRC 102515 = DSM 9628]
MTADPRITSINTIHELGLISVEERDDALDELEQHQIDLDDPQLAGLELDLLQANPSLIDTLAWLLTTQVLPADRLRQTLQTLPAHHAGDALSRRRDLIEQTLRHVHQAALKILYDEDLIDPWLRDAAGDSLPAGQLVASPVDALLLIVNQGKLTAKQFNALLARTRSGGSGLAVIIVHATAKRLAKQRPWLARLVTPGRHWLGLIGLPALLAAIVWSQTHDHDVPDCDSGMAQERIAGLLPSFKPGDISEAGYNPRRRIRACIVSAQSGAAQASQGYTIAASIKNDWYDIALAWPELLTARFGKLDKNGDFLRSGVPLGRDAMLAAFRTASAGISGEWSPPGAVHDQLSYTVSHDPAVSIDDLEPLGPCRAVRTGMRYACPVLVALHAERRELLRGEFTLERDAAGQPWAMSSRFASELARARATEN